MLLNTCFSHWRSLRKYLKGTSLIVHSSPNSATPLPLNLPRQINHREAQMTPQTRSAARKRAASELSQKNDPPTGKRPKVAKHIPELETTTTTPIPRPNSFCLSNEQIDRICGYFVYLPVTPRPLARATYKHFDNPPALLPAELDYLVTLLVPFYTPSPGPEAQLMSLRDIVDWSTVTAKFNNRFPKRYPRTEKVLKCGIHGNMYRILIAVFRDRCRKAHAGEDNAGIFSDFTPSKLVRFWEIYSRRWRL